ncbi:MAG TPA: UvrD-helicase domain-containing protein, partial [Chlamydiales bacterium]|nr:UvrD-helicase domain-containing protein [Chlamydiales bacterium]
MIWRSFLLPLKENDMDLTDLNRAQRQAVETVEGRLLILAGAGSGKTRVLTTRIAFLINVKGVSPDAIVGLTFTNKAAEEMRTRLASFVPPRLARRVTLSTFHSFCLKILRQEAHLLGFTKDFSLYDRQDVMRLMTTIARDLLDHEGAMPSLMKTYEAIGLAKNRAISFDTISGTGSEWHDDFTREVSKRLHDSFRAYNAVDFDHLLWLVAELFEKHPEVLKKYQSRFRYVLIDEYQDTSPIQAKIAEHLTAESGNFCVVGDDDQSIYSWRGADVANILRFENAKVVKLEQNFRSTNTILKAANQVIGKNLKRHKKELWSDKGDGGLIELFYAPNEVAEAEAVIARLLKLRERHNYSWGDFAILYRSNVLSRPLESALLRQRILTSDRQYLPIPYEVYGGDEFYDHKEVRDLLAYLRVIANPYDHEALVRIINYPRRGIGETALDAMTQQHRSDGTPLFELMQAVGQNFSDKAKAGVQSLLETIRWGKEQFAAKDFAAAFQELVQRLNFTTAIHEEVKSEQMRKIKAEHLVQLGQALKEYQERAEIPTLADFCSTAALAADPKPFHNNKKDDGDHVHLMTFHSAKGL